MKSRVFEIIAAEQARQNSTVELIASENFVSENVMKAVGSCLTNKYSEGYPAHRPSGNRGRFYGGCQYVDELEEYCCHQWQAVFQTDYHVNVQPHSGSSANLAAYMSVLKPGDTILAMSLNNGGHLTHGSPVNFSGKLFHMEFYGVDENGFIDYEDVRRKARECRPQLILAGASAYSRTIDFPAPPGRRGRISWWTWPTSQGSWPPGTIPPPSAWRTSSQPLPTRPCGAPGAD